MSKSLSILIVDDDPDIISIYNAMLSGKDHVVHSQTSSLETLNIVKDLRPDLLLLDLMMPDMDGLELLSRIRKMEDLNDLKIIVISAKSYEFDRKRALELGADGFIQKSTSAEHILEQIERIVEDKVTIAFWGVRGTIPVPGPDSLKFGGNTSCVSMFFCQGTYTYIRCRHGYQIIVQNTDGKPA